jgi:membrane-bound lytic murein transglycosylase B
MAQTTSDGKLVRATVLGLALSFAPTFSWADSFGAWIAAVKQEAGAAGIEAQYLAALDTLKPNARVRELASRQPEYIKPIWEYLDHMITPSRVADGQTQLRAYEDFLQKLQVKYGIPPGILMAIWGMETNFGKVKGSYPVLEALATLGYEGRRAAFGRQQILAALQILQAGDVSLADFKGSWAGAMGHTQFIPTTYLGYAVDATNDGKRDIWTSPHDALGSAANYLKVSGWRAGVPWGVRVELPAGFDYKLTGLKNRRSMADWQKLGIAGADEPIQAAWGEGAIYLPAGHRGPAYLATQNFFAILRYNTAPAYALSVGLLSERIEGGAPVALDWPSEDRPLLPEEIKELQGLLQKAGYKIGAVDGVPGPLTQAAVLDFQKQNKLVADGYATPAVLSEIRKILR